MVAVPEVEPRWLTLYRERAPAEEVAAAWKEGFAPEEQKQAEADPPLARATLRKAIVNSECPEVRADANNGWQYTGAILRAADAVLGIPPPKPRTAMPAAVPAAAVSPAEKGVAAVPSADGKSAVDPATSSYFRPKLVLEGQGAAGTLGLWWSDFETAVKATRLQQECGVTHRLNVAAECKPKLEQRDAELKESEASPLETLHVPMIDQFELEAEMPEAWPGQLREILERLRALRDRGAVVNVNCQMGKNRSGAVILLWLCCECDWSLDAAVQHLRGINPMACGNPHLLAAVAQLLHTTANVPLNPASDGGGWVCISPPGSPRVGRSAAFDAGVADAARRKLEAEAAQRGEELAQEDDDDDAGDMAPIFSELSDVD